MSDREPRAGDAGDQVANDGPEHASATADAWSKIDAPSVLRRGHADCEGLATWHAAEFRVEPVISPAVVIEVSAGRFASPRRPPRGHRAEPRPGTGRRSLSRRSFYSLTAAAPGELVILRLVNRGRRAVELVDLWIDGISRPHEWTMVGVTAREAPGLDVTIPHRHGSGPWSPGRLPVSDFGAPWAPTDHASSVVVECGGWVAVHARRSLSAESFAQLVVAPAVRSSSDESDDTTEAAAAEAEIEAETEIVVEVASQRSGMQRTFIGVVSSVELDCDDCVRVGLDCDDCVRVGLSGPICVTSPSVLNFPAQPGLGRLVVHLTPPESRRRDLAREAAAAAGRLSEVSVDASGAVSRAIVRVIDDGEIRAPAAWSGTGPDALPLGDHAIAQASDAEVGALLVREVSHDHPPGAPYVVAGACLICERHISVELMCMALASFRNVDGHSGYSRSGADIGETARAWQRIAEDPGIQRVLVAASWSVGPLGPGAGAEAKLTWQVGEDRVPIRVEVRLVDASRRMTSFRAFADVRRGSTTTLDARGHWLGPRDVSVAILPHAGSAVVITIHAWSNDPALDTLRDVVAEVALFTRGRST